MNILFTCSGLEEAIDNLDVVDVAWSYKIF